MFIIIVMLVYIVVVYGDKIKIIFELVEKISKILKTVGDSDTSIGKLNNEIREMIEIIKKKL